MKQNRENLENDLILICTDISSKKKIIDEVCEYTSERNMPRGKSQAVINQNNPMQMLPDEELCLIAMAVYEVTKKQVIEPSKYFFEEEMTRAEIYFKSKKKASNKVIIPNVILDVDGIYKSASVPITLLAEWWGNGLLTYNIEVQRPPKISKRKGQMLKKADINQDSVNEIAKEFEQETFFPNLITLNLRVTDKSVAEIDYNEDKQILTAYVDNENVFLDVSDGYHRIGGAAKAVRKNPNNRSTMFLRILDCDKNKVLKCIAQEANHNDLDPKATKRYGTNNKQMELIKLINEDGSETTNKMYHKLADDIKEVDYSNKYTTYTTLLSTIEFLKDEYNFSIDYEDMREIRKIKEFLIEGYSEILSIFKKEFKDKNIHQKTSYLTNSNMFILYTIVLILLKDREDWHNKLDEVLSKINFSKKNEFWKEIGFKTVNVNKVLIKKIANFVSLMID